MAYNNNLAERRELSKKHQFEMSSLETLYKKEYEDLENYYNIRFNDLESESREMEELNPQIQMYKRLFIRSKNFL